MLNRLAIIFAVAIAVLPANPTMLEARPTNDIHGDAESTFDMEALEEAASSGDPDASYRLGMFFALHPSSPGDIARAEDYLRFAAERDHVNAQHDLGLFLIGEDESDERILEGLYWLGSASGLGDALSAVVLGMLHEYGLYGVHKDVCLARDWYEAGALLGLRPPPRYFEDMSVKHLEIC